VFCYDPLVNQWLRLRATEEDMIVLGFLAGSKATSELPYYVELVQSLRALTVWALARHINPPSPHGKHERTRKLYHRPLEPTAIAPQA
jgi:hypothetical protein